MKLVVVVIIVVFVFQIPAIDASSDAGIIPDEFKADIELKGVNFSFPSRPDVQVTNCATT